MNAIMARYTVPVDDQWYAIALCGNPVKVAARTPYAVEFWAMLDAGPKATRRFRVYGTGHALPDDVIHVGTALADEGRLVWHLMEAVG